MLALIGMGSDRDSPFVPVTVLVLLAMLIGFFPLPSDPDLWFHLADGEYILEHHQVPDADPFSFTKEGESWVPHSWLFDVGVAVGWHYLGPRETEAIMALVFMVAMAISYALLTGRGVRPVSATVVCIALAIAAGNTRGVRPQVLSLLLTNVVIYLLINHGRRPSNGCHILAKQGWGTDRLLYQLPLIFLLWAQLHSACVMGLAVVVIWLTGRLFEALWSRSLEKRRRELVIAAVALALSIAAVLVTPHRVTHFRYVADTMNMTALEAVTEWQVPSVWPPEVPDVYVYLLASGLVVLLITRRREAVRSMFSAEMFLCAALVALGLTGVRHIPLACIGAVPLIGRLIGREAEPSRVATNLRRFHVVAGVMVGLLVLMVRWNYPEDVRQRYLQNEPVNGTRALADMNIPLRVFTTYNTGSYVLWAGADRLRVFVDSRADVFGYDLVFAADEARRGIDWEELFDEWSIEAAVVERDDPLAGILAEREDWLSLPEDVSALTFVHRSVADEHAETTQN